VEYIRLCFVTDATFYHDAFRTDYNHSENANWILFYTITRYTSNPTEKILLIPKPILDYLKREFRLYHDISPGIIRAISRITEIFPIDDVTPENATIYAALWLSSRDVLPIIISSVKKRKWIDRMRRLGIEHELEGFSSGMSDRRVEKTFPIYLTDANEARQILSKHDSEYQKIMRYQK